MTDRELLEKAAKAAGILGVWHEGWGCISLMGRPELIGPGGQSKFTWSPLTDDGDALRLAVKLELQLRLLHSENEVSVYGAPEGRIDESVFGDPYAATRRAIVRAAAMLA